MRRILRTFKNPQRISELRRCRTATPDWIQLLSAYVGFPFHPFSIRLASGPFEFLEKSDVATFWQVFFRNVYPVRPTDRLIVDAGANIGAFSLYALLAIHDCRVVAIEPSASSFARLEAVLHVHRVGNRCVPIRAALGACDGETTIDTAGGSQFRRSGRGGEPVRMTTLESIMPAEHEIDLLKMDTEGAEYDSLGSATHGTLRRIRRIALEYHPSDDAGPHRWQALHDRLTSAGFRLVSKSDDGGGYGVAHLER